MTIALASLDPPHALSLAQARANRRAMNAVKTNRRGVGSLLLSAVLLAVAASSSAGCAPRTITPAEIERNGTKTYYGRDAGQVTRATVTALQTLGYEVVVADVAGGKVKTSPKVVAVHAIGNKYSATALQDSLAWTIDLVKASDGTVVSLHPRFFRNGQPVDESQISADPMNKAFADLFREIDDNLPAGGGAPAGPLKPAPAKKPATTPKPSKVAKYAQ